MLQDSTSSGELVQQMSVMRMTPQSSTDSCGEQAIPAPQQPQPGPQPHHGGADHGTAVSPVPCTRCTRHTGWLLQYFLKILVFNVK